MKFTDFPTEVQEYAKEMAVAVNGGSWPQDYQNNAIQVGWALKVEWAMKNIEANT